MRVSLSRSACRVRGRHYSSKVTESVEDCVGACFAAQPNNPRSEVLEAAILRITEQQDRQLQVFQLTPREVETTSPATNRTVGNHPRVRSAISENDGACRISNPAPARASILRAAARPFLSTSKTRIVVPPPAARPSSGSSPAASANGSRMMNRAPSPRRGKHVYLAVVCRDDTVNHRQPETRTSTLSTKGEEGLKKVLTGFGRNSRAVVCDLEYRPPGRVLDSYSDPPTGLPLPHLVH